MRENKILENTHGISLLPNTKFEIVFLQQIHSHKLVLLRRWTNKQTCTWFSFVSIEKRYVN